MSIPDPAPAPASPPSPPVAEPPHYHRRHAQGYAVALVAIGIVLLLRPLLAQVDITAGELSGDDADASLATLIGLTLTLFGGALVLFGAWMAVVEWRGRFRAPEPSQPGVAADAGRGLPAIIEAVGRLQGAALVMVVGALLMLGAAWVAQSSAEPGAAGEFSPFSDAAEGGP